VVPRFYSEMIKAELSSTNILQPDTHRHPAALTQRRESKLLQPYQVMYPFRTIRLLYSSLIIMTVHKYPSSTGDAHLIVTLLMTQPGNHPCMTPHLHLGYTLEQDWGVRITMALHPPPSAPYEAHALGAYPLEDPHRGPVHPVGLHATQYLGLLSLALRRFRLLLHHPSHQMIVVSPVMAGEEMAGFMIPITLILGTMVAPLVVITVHQTHQDDLVVLLVVVEEVETLGQDTVTDLDP
jgi:hypothetical protein